MGYGGRLGENNGNDIEADLSPFNTCARGVRARRASDMPLFFPIDCALRGAKFSRSSRFDFDKDYGFSIAGDDVHFRFSWPKSIIPREDHKPFAAQITMG